MLFLRSVEFTHWGSHLTLTTFQTPRGEKKWEKQKVVEPEHHHLTYTT